MENMREIITFQHTVVVGFELLNRELQNNIYNIISANEYFNTKYEVLEIVDFKINDMIVKGGKIVCNLSITADVNNPKPGKRIFVNEFHEIKGDTIIYTSPGKRIQIIAKTNVPNISKLKDGFILEIIESKIVSKNILCVANLVEI
ncbi:hypothetical protein [Dasineura jujubifolia toursvirus 2a]|nr:hypothetical protein [Dasineura jujubifolia toursvirus 2a]